MLRTFLAVLMALTCGSLAWAQAPAAAKPPAPPADPWLGARYHLHLVFAFEKHPALTPEFVERTKKEVESALTLDLGSICTVDVLPDHPYLADVLANGLGELDKKQAVLDDAKTHFVRVRYDNGQYDIQVRQMDGSTGITGPLRRLSTPDRIWVSRAIGLTIIRDFGLVGMVVGVVEDTVDVKMRGLGAGDPESVRVQPGDVFALSRIQGKGSRAQGTKVPNTLLVVTSALAGNGWATKLYGSGREASLQLKKDTYRVIKLGTMTGPLNLQVIDAKSRDPIIAGVKTSLGSYERKIEELATNNQGRVRGKELYQNLVLIEMTLAGATMRMPLPILDDQPIIVALAGTKELERQELFNYRLNQWRRQYLEAGVVLRSEIDAIRELSKKDERASVGKAKDVLAKFEEDAKVLQRDLDGLREELGGTVPNGHQRIDAAHKALGEHAKVAREYLQDIIQAFENPTPAQTARRRGRMAEQAADYDEAVRQYEESLRADASQSELKERLDKLKNAMKSKGPKHDQAKRFVKDVWGTLQADDLKKRWKEAEGAVQEFQLAGDFPTALQMYVMNNEHMRKLQALYESLQGADDDDAEQKRKLLEKVYDDLEKLNDRIESIVRAAR